VCALPSTLKKGTRRVDLILERNSLFHIFLFISHNQFSPVVKNFFQLILSILFVILASYFSVSQLITHEVFILNVLYSIIDF